MRAEGLEGIECVYALVWPDYPPHIQNHPRDNRLELRAWVQQSGIPVWAWLNAQPDQLKDARDIEELDSLLDPHGWLLDIEGPWTKGAKLKFLLDGVPKTKPRRASLAGTTASHVEYDYRELDKQGFQVEWQAYWNSGEGPWPADAVREMYQSSFVIPEWEYRARIKKTYGWGQVTNSGLTGIYDSYKDPKLPGIFFALEAREWGFGVKDRKLHNRDGDEVGLLMGKVSYPNIRVALNATRPSSVPWPVVAASAKIPNAKKRGVAVYTAETASDQVIMDIARGAA